MSPGSASPAELEFSHAELERLFPCPAAAVQLANFAVEVVHHSCCMQSNLVAATQRAQRAALPGLAPALPKVLSVPGTKEVQVQVFSAKWASVVSKYSKRICKLFIDPVVTNTCILQFCIDFHTDSHRDQSCSCVRVIPIPSTEMPCVGIQSTSVKKGRKRPGYCFLLPLASQTDIPVLPCVLLTELSTQFPPPLSVQTGSLAQVFARTHFQPEKHLFYIEGRHGWGYRVTGTRCHAEHLSHGCVNFLSRAKSHCWPCWL